jgi:hydrogenase expression/formation protein HypD
MSMTHQIEAIAGLARTIGRPIRLMEVCGTHTMVGFRSGLRSLLPETVHLLSGPGCPVCVTPNRAIDRAIAMTSLPDVLVTTFGDMLRVPGTRSSLEQARADGGRVEIVYSPADALEKAARSPGTRVVFLGVGFETTVPAVAWTIRKAQQDGIGD